VVELSGALESHPRLVADDVEAKQRSVTDLIADTNVIATFESADELAAATARGRESKPASQKLHAGRRCRQLTRPEPLKGFCDTRGRHGGSSVDDGASADDLPADMYHPAGRGSVAQSIGADVGTRVQNTEGATRKHCRRVRRRLADARPRRPRMGGEEATSATPYASVTETMTADAPRVNTTIDLWKVNGATAMAPRSTVESQNVASVSVRP